ncbi:MAG: VCBS repeat-containing protein [Zavarzinella sp.]
MKLSPPLLFLLMWGTTTFGQFEKSFKMQEIAADLTVGYAVIPEDINRDGKVDIVVVDSKRIVWYENPTWKVHTILSGKTAPDNVCICAHDIDGDGNNDLILGADWKPFNTNTGGTLQWLKHPGKADNEWEVFPIGTEPTVHRVKIAHFGKDRTPHIVLAPLMGVASTKGGNWLDGRPVRILAYPIPKKPATDKWEPIVVSDSLNVVHNFWPTPMNGKKGDDLLCASYEGVSLVSQGNDGKWTTKRIGVGNQETPAGSRGASEIRLGMMKNKTPFIATIEPWHGYQVVVYTPPAKDGEMWERHVIDDHLRWGHAVNCADLDGDGGDELIIGVRDNQPRGEGNQENCGVRIYKLDFSPEKKFTFQRTIIENSGVAVEDMATIDLNQDGKPDIIAVGRATHNCRIYWNQHPLVK